MNCLTHAPVTLVRLLLLFVAAFMAAPGMAQAVGDWRRVPTATTLPPLSGFTLGPLPDGRLLMLGGHSLVPGAPDWVWDGIDWQPVSTQPMPSRDNAAMAQFGEPGQFQTFLVIYGGITGGTIRTDTWIANASGWQLLSANSLPGILTDTSMIYDAVSYRIVLIGKTLQGLFTTWFFDQSGVWSAGPTFVAADARLVRDRVRNEVLLLQGGFPSLSVSRLHEGAWQLLGTSAQRLALGEVAFDERRARTIVLQPFDSRDTVEWDGASFGARTLPNGQFVTPSVMGMGYDRRRGETILVADFGNGMETWRHAADAEPTATTFGQGCGSMPMLQLAAGSMPRPGASHLLQAMQQQPAPMLSVIGASHVQAGGAALPLPIPVGSLNCPLRVAPDVVTFLGSGAQASQLITLPNSIVLLAERYNAQVVTLTAAGVVGTSAGLELQVGEPLVEQVLVESFFNELHRDPLASGTRWMGGFASGGVIGGDGRHGSFSLDLATPVGGGVYQIDTDHTVIPASQTLSSMAETVTDGRFYFTDLVVPAGVTVRFVGTAPAQLFVRGETNIMGKLSVDAPRMPSQLASVGLAFGKLTTTFNAIASLTGQPGGVGGPGGGRGGNGGDRCNNLGPTIVSGVDVTSGQPGGNVRLPVGHAYAGAASNTGGRGSELTPSTGIWGVPTPIVGSIYCAYFSPGGAGGGLDAIGGVAATPAYVGTGAGPIVAGTTASGGVAFPLTPLPSLPPPGYSSLQHFSIGGSGGGGGGSHGYGLIALGLPTQRWVAGHGGTGGGGVLVVRSGSFLNVSGEVSARGGDGVLINGGNLGLSSPGGGGSGGSILLQARDGIFVTGTIDTGGGSGSRLGFIDNALQRVSAQAGDGASGSYRLEGQGVTMSGTGTPGYLPSKNSGALTDWDALTGSRSKWLRPVSTALPVYLRYELLVNVGGLPVLYSDDPMVSPLAADNPAGAVLLRFQGAQIDPVTGDALPGTEGPWRSRLILGTGSLGTGTLNADRAQVVRFDMVMNSSFANLSVLELRIVWR